MIASYWIHMTALLCDGMSRPLGAARETRERLQEVLPGLVAHWTDAGLPAQLSPWI